MTVPCHPDLHRLALAAAVDSPASFSLLGRQITTAPPQLLRLLESELYHRLYCGATEPEAPQTEDPAEALTFIAALARANAGTGTWEPGWTFLGQADGTAVTVARDGVTFWTERNRVRTAAGDLTPGAPCSVRIGKEMRHLLSGFYMALGDIHPEDGADAPPPLVRLYWHLTPDTAIRYMREATSRLNAARIPFETKVVSNPRLYSRTDSGVLYLRRDDFGRTTPLLQTIYQRVRAGLLPEAPLFTKPLAPGLALAEDPGGGISFGQSRCRLAAQGLWQAYTQGFAEPDARLNAVAEAFQAEGLDPERPYLEPGSADDYALNLEAGE
ncbi:MAG: T3SS effector HopA1 family protein [Mycobacterium leprae]